MIDTKGRSIQLNVGNGDYAIVKEEPIRIILSSVTLFRGENVKTRLSR